MLLKKIKLNNLAMQELSKASMDLILGGTCCTCACAYYGYGGSSTSDNNTANTQNGHYDDSYECPGGGEPSTSEHMTC
jgi:natural product precursor